MYMMDLSQNWYDKTSKELTDKVVTNWSSFTQEKKQDIAIGLVGRLNSSEFVVSMDKLVEEKLNEEN